MNEPILCERGDDGVCRIRLNRPHKLNALDDACVRALLAIQASVADDPAVRVVLLSGEGRSFCAGADLDYAARALKTRQAFRAHNRQLHLLIRNFERLPQPVVAAVHGHILAGGLELAMGCDIIVAARSAQLGDQHMRRGLIPGGGSTQRIPERIGKAHAMDLLLTGRWLSADEALLRGLISRVVEDDQLMTAAEAVAAELTQTEPHALQQVKRLVNSAYTTALQDGLDNEQQAVTEWYGSPAFWSALGTFVERDGS